MDDAAEGLRHELSRRGLPRDACARRRARTSEVGDVVSRQPAARAADGDRGRAVVRRGEWSAAGSARRCGGDGAPHRSRCGARSRDARPSGRGDGRGDRRGRQRTGGGEDVRRAGPAGADLGRERGARPAGRRGARRRGCVVAPDCAGRRLARDGHAGPRGAADRGHAPPGTARLADGRRRAGQGGGCGFRAQPRPALL